MKKDIVIAQTSTLDKKIAAMQVGGASSTHVLADFDRTMTKTFVAGQKAPTVIAQIRNGNYLTPDYSSRAHALFDYYHPFEIDPKLPRDERSAKMLEWWQKHNALLAECGLTKDVMDKIVVTKTLIFRDKALEFIDFLHEHEIPLVVMSAAPAYMISHYLRQENRLYENVHVIANEFEFDEHGKVLKAREPVIHSMNKHETIVKDFPVFKTIWHRKNVILLGDTLEDLGMIEGFTYDNLITIGFYPFNDNEQLQQYQESFDVVLTGDQGMEYCMQMVERICNSS